MADLRATFSDQKMSDQSDIKSALEATFGPGAFELLDDDSDEQSSLPTAVSTAVEDSATVAGQGDHESLVQDGPTETISPARSRHRLVFEIAATQIAVPLANIVEVQPLPKITWMPRVPAWVRGVVSLRGKIVSVCDLSLFLGLSPVPANGGQLMIVVQSLADSIHTALIADAVIGIREIEEDEDTESDSMPCDAEASHAATAVQGSMAAWSTVELDGRAVCVVDLEEMLLSNKMRRLQAHYSESL